MMKPPKMGKPGFGKGPARGPRPVGMGGMTKPVPAYGKGPAVGARPMGMAKGGAVPMKFGKKMAAFEKSPMDMREDKAGMKKMADKAKAKGKKMMPAFMKKGAR